MQIANNINNRHHHHKNNSLENNISSQNYTKYNNYMNTKSRNKNLLNHIKSVDGKLNGLTISNL